MTNKLERKLQRQLYIARAPSSQERIANGHIRCRCGREEALAYRTATDKPWPVCRRALGIARHRSHAAVGLQVHQEVGQGWIGKIGMIEQVENVETELHVHSVTQ